MKNYSYDDLGRSSIRRTVLIAHAILIPIGMLTDELVAKRDIDLLEKAKANLDATVARKLNYTNVDVNSFEWKIGNDDRYLFKFAGNAQTTTGGYVDFFECIYEVNEQQYSDVIKKTEDIKTEEKDEAIRVIHYVDLMNKITEIIQNAELVATREKQNIVTAGTAGQESFIILNVTNSEVNGDKVIYSVTYARRGQDNDGNAGLIITTAEVSYDLTDELKENPNRVFTLNKDDANTKILESKFGFLEGSNIYIEEYEHPVVDKMFGKQVSRFRK